MKGITLQTATILFWATAAWAVPQSMTYQGTLKQKGIPVTGPVVMQFAYINADGTAIPGVLPISTNVVVTNGLFAVQLPIPQSVDWTVLTPAIQVSVGSQQLSPPQTINSNLYAVVSQTVVDGAITQAKLDPGVTTQFVPTSAIMAFAGPTAPVGWLACDGSAVSRITYASLFSVIGTVWGSGDGTETFNLPDLRGRAPIGVGEGAGLTDRSLAQTIGEESHTLSIAEMPSHSHSVIDPGHQHESAVGGSGPFGGGPVRYPVEGGTGYYNASTSLTSVVQTGLSIASAGGGTAHNVMQPSSVVTFAIKY